ncbi:nuclear transport factor 2 family protein [Flavobacterium sp.]|jgi:ketosteroid isomerase-like protein|uniref:nuclear transport factor 2 family protein n=1 Tax=Flavobacterium sp. TaxID=239 RepID=UPI0025BC3B2C|nr:nuclear transport factor 2 family protein [Flavobacterium sp.]
MSKIENLSIAKNWFEAFNTHDLDALLSLYDDEASHFSPKLKIKKPETKGLIKGKTELKLWWEEAFNNLPSLKYKNTSLTANEERVFMEYIRQVEGEDDMDVAELLEIEKGKIVFSRVYHG